MILTCISTYRNGGLIYLFDLGVSTDLLPELLQDLANVAPSRGCCNGQLELNRLGVVLEELLCLFWIER